MSSDVVWWNYGINGTNGSKEEEVVVYSQEEAVDQKIASMPEDVIASRRSTTIQKMHYATEDGISPKKSRSL